MCKQKNWATCAGLFSEIYLWFNYIVYLIVVRLLPRVSKRNKEEQDKYYYYSDPKTQNLSKIEDRHLVNIINS